MKNYKYYGAIEESGLFDEKFYSKTYDDVKGDGLTHYLVKGYLEGRLPSLDFDPDFYNNNYPDVHRAQLNPLLMEKMKAKYFNMHILLGEKRKFVKQIQCS